MCVAIADAASRLKCRIRRCSAELGIQPEAAITIADRA